MTRKQIGAILGAIVLAVAAPLLVLALLHGADRTAQANPGSVDKAVLDIIFDDADNYPDEGADIGNEMWVNKSENVPFSITSEDVNYGPNEPLDAEISFYMDVPAGCSARWYDPAGHFPWDIQTIDGDENQMSSGTVWFPPAKEAGPVRLDLHFQTAEYGLYEPVGQEQRYTRFFEIHCYGAGDYVFTFCNRADPKFDTDPEPANNLLCEDLTVHSLHNADIKVLNFYSDPPPPFTFDVSTYNVIDLIENKHNNGPQDAWSSVYWSMDPIEDRDGDGIPDINVRWEAQVGDLCTYQGLPVPCGEGDGVGTGGSGDGFPSLTGDNCQDGVDNDGDQTCDITGCDDPTQGPLPADPDCQVDIDDIWFAVWLPVSADEMVSRPLKLHCKPRSDTEPYTLTLYNEEEPFNPDDPGEEWIDPDPESNFQVLDIDVTCQVADPHYKCYDIWDGTGYVGELVTLEDQFHTQTGVEVQYPQELCPPAIKYVDGEYAGGGTAAPHLKAYNIVGMPDADATVNITTQFGTETDVVVGAAHRLLVPALKTIAPDLPTGELPLAPHYVCYFIPPATPPPGLIIDLETQFGMELDVEFVADIFGSWLCAPALKNGDGDLTAPHLRCYDITGGTAPGHIVNLKTQFPLLETDVDVGEPWTMCVPAEKEIVTGAEADKDVMAIIFDEADSYPDEGTELVPSNEYTIQASENEDFSVTSVEYNWGPDEPADAEISFYANIPAGCEGQWVADAPFPFDILTLDGDPGVPSSGTPTVPGMVAGPRWVDLHFQTLEYGLTEPVAIEDPTSPTPGLCNDGIDNGGDGFCDLIPDFCGPGSIPDPDCDIAANAQRYTRFFEIHCYEDADYVFEFCNRADVKSPDTDPDASNNLRCRDLTVHSEVPPTPVDLSIRVDTAGCTTAGGPTTCNVPVNTQFTVTMKVEVVPPGPPGDFNMFQAYLTHTAGLTWVDRPGTGEIVWVCDLPAEAPGAGYYLAGCTQMFSPPETQPIDVMEVDYDCGASPSTETVTMVHGFPNNTFLQDSWSGVHVDGGIDSLTINCQAALPAEIKWAQMPDDSPWGLDVSAYEPFVLAEDFLCTQSGLIMEIDFWASWFADSPPEGDPNAVAFTLSLHSDVPAGEDLPWSHPGEMLWSHPFDVFQCTAELWGMGEEGWLEPPDYYEPFADTQIWLYSCPIPEPYWFQQEEGTVYWLDVQAMPMGPEMFGWKTSIEHWNDDGVWAIGSEPIDPLTWSELRYPPGHPLFPESIDLSFQLWGQECDPLLDSDGDGFNDAIECYLPTDFRDDCTDGAPHDAWPLDINMDKKVTVVGDVLNYAGNIGAFVTNPTLQRLDLNKDNKITVVGDVLNFAGMIGHSCT